jgi:hypothetical protein
MRTQPLVGYGGYTPEEFQLIVRRAHVERAKFVGEVFASLLAWRPKAAERGHTDDSPLKTAACH